MKKKIILLLVFIVSLTSGCTQTNNTVMKPMDLSTILEVDSEQSKVEAEFNHKNLISDKPEYFTDNNVAKNKRIILNDNECDLIYKDSLCYPIGNKKVHRYFVDGDENKTILIDEQGNINSILYRYTKIVINKTASPEVVLKLLQEELSKIIDISYYKNVKTPDYNQKTDGFGVYDYLFYNKYNDYITDYLRVSVIDDGSVLGLSINNLDVDDFRADINKEKLEAAIEMKLKNIYDTKQTQYQSYFTKFDPCIVQYDDTIYVQCFVVAKYTHETNGEMSSYINNILIPINELNA